MTLLECFLSHRINIDEHNYFKIDGFTLQLDGKTLRIYNLYSIVGNIEKEFSSRRDYVLKQIIDTYLQVTDNVELINAVSRDLNDYDWFEAYDEHANSNVTYSIEELMRLDCKVSINKFVADVRGSNQLIPNKLYEYLNAFIYCEKHYNLEEFECFPVWFKNSNSELYCTIEIVLHILSKRFSTFKTNILRLYEDKNHYDNIESKIDEILKINKCMRNELQVIKSKKRAADTKKMEKEISAQKEIDKLKAEVSTMKDFLLSIYPNINPDIPMEFYINKRYRPVRIDESGNLWAPLTTGRFESKLTAEQIMGSIIRDSYGNKFRGGKVL